MQEDQKEIFHQITKLPVFARDCRKRQFQQMSLHWDMKRESPKTCEPGPRKRQDKAGTKMIFQII